MQNLFCRIHHFFSVRRKFSLLVLLCEIEEIYSTFANSLYTFFEDWSIAIGKRNSPPLPPPPSPRHSKNMLRVEGNFESFEKRVEKSNDKNGRKKRRAAKFFKQWWKRSTTKKEIEVQDTTKLNDRLWKVNSLTNFIRSI